MNNQKILYRQMEEADISAGLLLCRSVGWNQTAKDWELFLELNPNGGCVAADETGKVVGTVTTVRYQDHFSWIGMVLVDPVFQRRGIGLQLVNEALRILDQEATVKLDATLSGREVYLKFGFVDDYRLSRMVGNVPSTDRLPVSPAVLMSQNDFRELLVMDREVFGGDREALLKHLLDNAQQYAWVVKDNSQIKGYCFGRDGHRFTQIGPVIANDLSDAAHLVSAVMRNQFKHPVILDVLSDGADWISLLKSFGFSEQRQFVRMIRGSNRYPGQPQNQFAILGPEFG